MRFGNCGFLHVLQKKDLALLKRKEGMEPVTYGNGIPGFEAGEKNAPAIVLVQVGSISG